MKDLYIFPAIFHSADDGISITFPDLPGCLPYAQTMEEAFYLLTMFLPIPASF